MESGEEFSWSDVVIAAGGLGTRRSEWSRYLPKEYFPVQGKPGITFLLEEIAELGRVRAVVVHHPYYSKFVTSWAQRVLGDPRAYDHQIAGAPKARTWPEVSLRFTIQRGPYSDITSVLNADDELDRPGNLYIAYADNLYPRAHPMLRLREAEAGTSVLARPYRREEASQRGVLVTDDGFVSDVVEKPDRHTAQALEQRFGGERLALLEGRARADRSFLDFLRAHSHPHDTEPKLSLALAAYARTHRVGVCRIDSPVTDLGTPS
jgi:NDP-sugar pyrophosphorylase family protein